MNTEQQLSFIAHDSDECRLCILETMKNTVDAVFNIWLKDYGALYKGTKADLLKELGIKNDLPNQEFPK